MVDSSQRLTRSGSATMQIITIICFFLSLFITPSSAFWIMNHHPLNFNARLDPIVNPGTVSGHTHSFVGSNAISATSDYNSLRSSSACTTSGVDADKSLYWTPTLYSYSKDADTFTAFPMINANTYYLQRGNLKLQAFPPGLRMIAGNPAGRDLAPSKQLQDAVSFVCLNYKGKSAQTSTMPTTACPDGIRAQLVFPSCWDGKNLDSADHKSHMAYPLGDHPDNGDTCPSTHPIRFITLFYEFIWNVGKDANKGNWIFANGDSMGYAFHGDFMNGWTTDVLQTAIDQCTGQLFNNLEGCAPFKPTLNRQGASQCKVDSSKVQGLNSEDVNGPLKRLPGSNAVFNGAYKGAGAGAGASTSPTGTSATGSTTATGSTASQSTIATGTATASSQVAGVATSATATGTGTSTISLSGSTNTKVRVITGTSTQTLGGTSTVTVVYTKTLTQTGSSRQTGHHHKYHYKNKHHHKSKHRHKNKWSKTTEAIRIPKVTPRVSTITGTTTETRVYTSTVTYTDSSSSSSTAPVSLLLSSQRMED